MRRTSFARWPCSVARAMDLLGDQWTLLVLREAYRGVRRFDRFQAELGIARTTLTERLDRLTGAGVLEGVPYQQRPTRHEYVPTEMGRDFFPVLAAIMHWGDRWLDDGAGAPALLRHERCGHRTRAVIDCARCGDELALEDVRVEPGPGLREPLDPAEPGLGGARSVEGV